MAAAELLAVKARTGAFPATLPAAFIDPFNGKPLGYRLDAKVAGFVVYSVGFDGTYKGGQPSYKEAFFHAVFYYPAPPQTPVPKIDE